MVHISKKDAIKQSKEAEKQQAAADLLQQKLDALTSEIEDLELTLPDISDIDLLNVEVNSKKDGVGTVIEHDFNHIKVQFGNTIKKYDLDTKYRMRPSFENDVEVVTAYTEYNAISDKITRRWTTDNQMKLWVYIHFVGGLQILYLVSSATTTIY